jgi:hypothetical protein
VASQLTPWQVVTLLNELFSVFDELTRKNNVYKVVRDVDGEASLSHNESQTRLSGPPAHPPA